MNSMVFREIRFLIGCLERARIHATLLHNDLLSGTRDLDTARHRLIGIGGQLQDAREIVLSLRPQLSFDENRALITWLGNTVAAARRLDRHPLPLNRSRRLISRLDRTLELAEDIAASIDQIRDLPAPSRASRRLAAWAVRVLPPAHRVRYREEFLAELHDLRDRQQLRHGLRLLVRAMALRRGLPVGDRAPRRAR